jgi:rSAM-associated Gly-rich repeat protein
MDFFHPRDSLVSLIKETIMSATKRTSKALALLLPTGVLGISSALAATQSHTVTPAGITTNTASVEQRLNEIRGAVSAAGAGTHSASGAKLLLAEWLNFGNGLGWRNGGNWHNGGWGNGGWGNGGWHNWGNGWHNWHNFWHNW